MVLVLKFLGVVLAASSLLCVVLLVRKHFILRSGTVCAGTVVGHERKSGSDGDTLALVIDYADPNGVPRSFTTSTSSSPASRAVGEDVEVFHFRDERPPEVMVFAHLYAGYWVWLCVSVCAAGWLLAPRLLTWLYSS